MRIRMIFLMLGLGLCPLAAGHAAEMSPGRDDVISQKLDCVSQALKVKQSLAWADVCVVSDSPVHAERARTIEQALDTVESVEGLSPPEASSLPAPAPEPSAVPLYPPERQSAVPLAVESQELRLKERPRTPEKTAAGPKTGYLHIFARENELTKLELAPELYYYRYAEPNFMKDAGYFTGFSLRYTYRISENKPLKDMSDTFSDGSTLNMFRFEGRAAFGKVDYQSEGTGEMDSIKDYVIEVRGLAGYDLPASESLVYTPYIGFGYRYLNDDTGGMTTTTGHSGYERESSYYYVPLGLEAVKRLPSRWAFRVIMEYDWFVSGRQISHLEDVSSAYDPVENDQRSGFGVRGSIQVLREGEAFDLFVEPFIRYWDMERSDASTISYSGVAVGTGVEPENNTTEVGAQAGIRY